MNAFYVLIFTGREMQGYGKLVELGAHSDDEAAKVEFHALAGGQPAILLKITDDEETIIDRVGQ